MYTLGTFAICRCCIEWQRYLSVWNDGPFNDAIICAFCPINSTAHRYKPLYSHASAVSQNLASRSREGGVGSDTSPAHYAGDINKHAFFRKLARPFFGSRRGWASHSDCSPAKLCVSSCGCDSACGAHTQMAPFNSLIMGSSASSKVPKFPFSPTGQRRNIISKGDSRFRWD